MAKFKPIKSVQFTVGEDVWTASLYREKSYIKMHGDDSDAITLPAEKEIHFPSPGITAKSCRHEMVHAYATLLHISSTTSLTLDDYEEIWAEFLSGNIDRISQKANFIFKALKLEPKPRRKSNVEREKEPRDP
jgi:hypothetical protein